MGLFSDREVPHKTATMGFRQIHRREFDTYTTKKALLAKCLFKMVRPTGNQGENQTLLRKDVPCSFHDGSFPFLFAIKPAVFFIFRIF